MEISSVDAKLGEFASPSENQFHHYRDFWMFDLKKNSWERLDDEKLSFKGIASHQIGPSARSGHRMVLWKNFIILFGGLYILLIYIHFILIQFTGFYDTYIETKYYNDLWAFDINNSKWIKLSTSDTYGKSGEGISPNKPRYIRCLTNEHDCLYII